MGAEEFYVYAGSVQRLPCSVRDYVFNDINSDQLEKVTAGLNSAFAEVTWFYPLDLVWKMTGTLHTIINKKYGITETYQERCGLIGA